MLIWKVLPGGPKYRGVGSRELWESSKVSLLLFVQLPLGVHYSRADTCQWNKKIPVPPMSVKRQVSLSLPDNLSLHMTPIPPTHECPHDWINPHKKTEPGPLLHSFSFTPSLRHVFYINFYINWGTTFFQQVGKCYIWLRPYRRGLRFGTYLGWNFRFGLRSRGQNVSKWLFFDRNAQIRSVRIFSNGLKFGMNIGLYMGQILG